MFKHVREAVGGEHMAINVSTGARNATEGALASPGHFMAQWSSHWEMRRENRDSDRPCCYHVGHMLKSGGSTSMQSQRPLQRATLEMDERDDDDVNIRRWSQAHDLLFD